MKSFVLFDGYGYGFCGLIEKVLGFESLVLSLKFVFIFKLYVLGLLFIMVLSEYLVVGCKICVFFLEVIFKIIWGEVVGENIIRFVVSFDLKCVICKYIFDFFVCLVLNLFF